MSTDLARHIVEEASALVRSAAPFRAVVDRVVELGGEAMPSPVWEAIAAVDVDTDVERAAAWLLRQMEHRPPPDDLSGLWFGLYEVRGAGPGRTEAVLAASGGAGFPDEGWLSKLPWDAAGYAPTPGLRSLLPLAATADEDLRWLVGYAVVFAYTLGLTAAVLDSVDAASLLGDRKRLGIAAGFHDGDIALVGVLTPDGFDRSDLGLQA